MTKLSHFKCDWHHQYEDEPVTIYSEIDSERYETRKVECFPDGSIGIADGSRSTRGTRLGTLPVPELAEINRDTQFHAKYISRDEFEAFWKEAQ